MEYIEVKWIHSNLNDPVLLYSELDDERWEIPEVDVFADGTKGYADAGNEKPSKGTYLSEEPLPQLTETAVDPQFEPIEISKDEFETVWKNREDPAFEK